MSAGQKSKERKIIESIILFVGGTSVFILVSNHFILTPIYVSLGYPVNSLIVVTSTLLSLGIALVPMLILAFVSSSKGMKQQNKILAIVCFITLVLLAIFFPLDQPSQINDLENMEIIVHEPDGSVRVIK